MPIGTDNYDYARSMSESLRLRRSFLEQPQRVENLSCWVLAGTSCHRRFSITPQRCATSREPVSWTIARSSNTCWTSVNRSTPCTSKGGVSIFRPRRDISELGNALVGKNHYDDTDY